MKNIAVILAGGIGSRVGGDTPKQFLLLDDGRSVLEHSVDAFEQASCIDEIAVVMHPEWLAEAAAMIERNGWRKVRQLIPGGSERWESSWRAVEEYMQSAKLGGCISLLLHDAARPFVSQRIIADVCQALETHQAVTVAVPSTDTLYKVQSDKGQSDKGMFLEEVLDRLYVWRAQTPQAFHLGTIAEAFRKAMEEGQIAATDDIGIVHRYMTDVPVFIVPGEERNRKITYQEDFKP